MPPASEACVGFLRKETDPLVNPFAGWWHAFQLSNRWGDRPGVSLRPTPRLISLNPAGSLLRIQELTRRSEDPLQFVQSSFLEVKMRDLYRFGPHGVAGIPLPGHRKALEGYSSPKFREALGPK